MGSCPRGMSCALIVAMPVNPATAADVTRLLGDIDAIVLERILATGATPDEIGEALRVVEDERGFGEVPHEPSTPKVAEVRAVLHEMSVLEPEGPEDEDMM